MVSSVTTRAISGGALAVVIAAALYFLSRKREGSSENCLEQIQWTVMSNLLASLFDIVSEFPLIAGPSLGILGIGPGPL